MFQNYLKTAWRNIAHNKTHSAINVFGLAVGLAAMLAILLYLQSERRHDKFHVLGDRLYRVGMAAYREGVKESEGYTFTPPIGPAMKAELAGVKNYTRYAHPRSVYFSTEKKTLKTEDVLYADSTFFDLFSFRLLSGNAKSALTAPYGIVLTEGLAKRFFGDENPLGKTLRLNNDKELQVTGVVDGPPANSHITFQALISFSTLFDDPGNFMDWDGGEQYVTYVLLEQNADARSVEKNLPGFMWRHINEKYAGYGIRLEPSLQPMREIHLRHNPYSASLRTNLAVLGAMAVLILMIACINFVNIATARAGQRAQEVGVRKVLGANRTGLARQFLTESFLLTGLAFLVALLLFEAFLPVLPRLLGKEISMSGVANGWAAAVCAGLFLLVGLAAGGYPALYLSSLDAVKSLKKLRFGSTRSGLRNVLVVFQFAISTALIIGALVVSSQLNFAKTKALGFEKENKMVLPLVGEAVQSKAETLRQALSATPQVLGAAASSEVPGEGFTTNGYVPEGIENPMLIHVVDVGDGFFPLYGLKITAGRAISPGRPSDQTAYLINETLAKQLGWDDPIGKKINRNGEHEVVGVVEDFHFASLHETIGPLIVTCAPWNGRFDYLTVNIAPGNLAQAVQAVRTAWEKTLPGTPFEFWFLDDELDSVYRTERRLGEAFLWFSALSVMIALMGIFGLSTFTIGQRTKEIGVRKVLGASVTGIVGLLSKDFLSLVLVALVIASPLAYYFMEKWLGNFAYRIELQWWVFALAGAAAIAGAAFTVALQTIKAALTDPVKSLRSE